MPHQRKRTNYVAILDVAEEHGRQLWRAAIFVGILYFGFYYFAEVWPALLCAGSG